MRPPVAESQWAARSARARELAAARPEARDALEFLSQLTALQQELAAQYRSADAALPRYLEWLSAHAPGPLAQTAARLTALPVDPGIETAEAFVVEALLQAFPPDPCPYCRPPVVSLLREAGHGARRSFICAVCQAESSAPRLGCVACGEQRVEMLAVYRTEVTDPARIDACESCRAYVKTIDLTRDGAACPVADDLASVSLDLWARDQGYHRVRPNLLRL